MQYSKTMLTLAVTLACLTVNAEEHNKNDNKWLLEQQKTAQKAIEKAKKDGLLNGLSLKDDLTEEQIKAASKLALRSLELIKETLPVKKQSNKENKSLLADVDGAMFISFSMPKKSLIEVFKIAHENNLTIIIKGLIAGTNNIKPTMKLIHSLSKIAEVEPKIGIDPLEFERYQITAVPAIVLKSSGRITKATGVIDVDYVKEAHANEDREANYLDMGVDGQVFSVDERSMVDSMKAAISEIDWNKKKANAVKRFWSKQKQVILPDSLVNESWVIDPTVRVTKDITNSKGDVLARAGDITNPFKKFPLRITILVINASKPSQIKWAKDNVDVTQGTFQIHVTGINQKNGWDDIARIRNELGAPVFMIPNEIKTKFNIKALPTKISTNDNGTLTIEQFNSLDLNQ